MNTSVLKVAALAGDGIGPEVMAEAVKVLRTADIFSPTEPNTRCVGTREMGDAITGAV